MECISLVPDVFPFLNNFSQPIWGYAGEIQNTPFMKHSSAIYKNHPVELAISQINLLVNQPSWQTVSQDSFLITLLVNKWSASLSNRQSRQLCNNSAGQQVIN